ncbi:anti sigma factor C-terminal domain-containing protein [Bacillus sp. PS06]|uniref:anti sigma factor C-terminal domain-containing protein n=1 Tax=Bacillus sp. PS06 TaxID=2764176 RepID=UPI0017844700|nr:anti sigma factor C-terminal domain-containing protein [Bacillus sp. PS06]MBD8069511.1 anti sigma factor C-terminal domain-containing protein [Bacillus sp. PS06]
MTEWSKDKEKKILWKYRFLLTARIVRVLLIIGGLYFIYSLFLTIGYSQTDIGSKHKFNMNLAIDWTQGGLYSEYLSHPDPEITPFFTQHISLPLYRTIGKDKEPVATLDISKRVFTAFSSKQLTYHRLTENQWFHFYLPEHPKTGEKLYFKNQDDVWDPLEKVHEGTVADLAFSTDQYYDPEELLKILGKYDLDVLWMPLYSGELKEIEDVGYGLAGGSYLSVETLGLSRGRELLEGYHAFSEVMIREDSIADIEKIMLKNMDELIKNESKTYIEQFLGLRYLEERHSYLKENGFQVYGAVVTGPVKELLKLKEEETFRGVQVGEFDYWNWEKTE